MMGRPRQLLRTIPLAWPHTMGPPETAKNFCWIPYSLREAPLSLLILSRFFKTANYTMLMDVMTVVIGQSLLEWYFEGNA